MKLVYEKSIQYINWTCCKSLQIYILDSDLATKTLIINVAWFTNLEKLPYLLEITTDFYARDTLHSSWQTPAMTTDEKPSVNYYEDLKDIF